MASEILSEHARNVRYRLRFSPKKVLIINACHPLSKINFEVIFTSSVHIFARAGSAIFLITKFDRKMMLNKVNFFTTRILRAKKLIVPFRSVRWRKPLKSQFRRIPQSASMPRQSRLRPHKKSMPSTVPRIRQLWIFHPQFNDQILVPILPNLLQLQSP